jgi:hypothetical protein
VRVTNDAETDILSAEASSAICVQRFDDSRNSAIHTTYRISLRSSSLREPRYPLLRVVFWLGMSSRFFASSEIVDRKNIDSSWCCFRWVRKARVRLNAHCTLSRVWCEKKLKWYALRGRIVANVQRHHDLRPTRPVDKFTVVVKYNEKIQ